jgi:hypothetical protein
MSDDKKSGNDGFRFVPLIFVFVALMMLVTRPSYYGGSSYTPLPPRPKITTIPANEPSVLAFKTFAETNKLTWEISPSTDGTDYCASARTSYQVGADRFFIGVSCRDTIKEAVDNVIDQWNRRAVRAGS